MLERVDFPAGREKFLFQPDHLDALARGQLTLLISQVFRGLPCPPRRFLCRLGRLLLERVDFPAGREKFLFQRDHLDALARGQLTLLISQLFRGLPLPATPLPVPLGEAFA